MIPVLQELSPFLLLPTFCSGESLPRNQEDSTAKMGREKDRHLVITFQYLKPVMPTASGHFSFWNQHFFFDL